MAQGQLSVNTPEKQDSDLKSHLMMMIEEFKDIHNFCKEIEEWWSYLCSQVCRHSWETSSLLVVFVYVALWHRISSGHRQRPEDSFLRQHLGSCIVRVLGRFP